MFTWLKNIFRRKKDKEQIIRDAVDRTNTLIANCEKEEKRLKKEIAGADKKLTRLEDDSEEASQCKARRQTCVYRVEEIQNYIHILIHQISQVELHHITRQLAQVLKLGDKAKY